MIASYVALQEGVIWGADWSSLPGSRIDPQSYRVEKAANGADILSDVYNANPTAMKLILETFSAILPMKVKKVAVLADMKELGDQSVQLTIKWFWALHPDALDTVIFYGEDIAELAQLASQMFPNRSCLLL